MGVKCNERVLAEDVMAANRLSIRCQVYTDRSGSEKQNVRVKFCVGDPGQEVMETMSRDFEALNPGKRVTVKYADKAHWSGFPGIAFKVFA